APDPGVCEGGGCAAEHMGEDSPPLAAAHALARLDDVLAALLHVVVGPDRHRLDLLLRAHHVLQGRAELGGEAPMGNKYEADHGAPRRRVPVAPHERPPIMTIRSLGARAFAAIWERCCISAKGALPAPGEAGNYCEPVTFVPPGAAARNRGLMSPSGERRRARTRASASAPGATASRRNGTPRSAVSPAAGSRSASSAARSTTEPTTPIGSSSSRRIPRPRTP